MKDDKKDSKPPFNPNINEFIKHLMNQFNNLKEFMESNTLEPSQPIVWGWSTHIGSDGVPHIRQFGNFDLQDPKFKHSLEEITPRNKFEPFYDIIVDDETNEIVIIVEVPGISKEELELYATDDAISLKSSNPQYNYDLTIPLKQEVDPQSMKATLNNGVLELKAKRVNDTEKKGEKIPIGD